MSTLDDLFADIVEHPDDDEPRLVWADAVGGERGELVVIQCEIARGKIDNARQDRQRELLLRHGAEWSGLAKIATRVSFARGFVDAAEVPSWVVYHRADDIRRAAPLLASLNATGFHFDELLNPLLQLRGIVERFPGLLGIDVLDESHAGPGIIHADRFMEILVERGGFRSVGIRTRGPGRFARQVMIELLASEMVRTIERLAIGDYMPPDSVPSLFRSAPMLRAIELVGTEHLAIVPASITELRLLRLDNSTVEALASSPAAATLEYIELGEPYDPGILERFFPKLRAVAFERYLLRVGPTRQLPTWDHVDL